MDGYCGALNKEASHKDGSILPDCPIVPVVRCKDCKYNKEHHPFNGKERITVFWCEMENRNARHNDNPDWFCADWKKKDG